MNQKQKRDIIRASLRGTGMRVRRYPDRRLPRLRLPVAVSIRLSQEFHSR